MHLSTLVISGGIGLETRLNCLIVNDNWCLSGGKVNDDFQNIEKFSRITSGVSQKRLIFIDLDLLVLQYLVFAEGAGEEVSQVRSLQ